MFEQAPTAICLLRGPEHRLVYYNPAYQALFPNREMQGQTVMDAQPEALKQGFVDLLDQVYQSGETYFGREMRLVIDQLDGDLLKEHYFNFTYQAYKEHGRIVGITVFAYDVTEQVNSRQGAERQRQLLYQLYQDVPAAICILDGPTHVYELVNTSYEQLFPGRALLGKPLLEALPDMAHLDAYRTLRRVYETGQTHQELGTRILVPQYPGGPLEERYFNFVQQARRNAQGQIDGVMVFTFEVTEQVHAYEAAERQRRLLHALYTEAPLPIAVFEGPTWTYQLVNAAYQGVFPGRVLLGRPLLEAMPELIDSPLPAIFERVYRTGKAFSAHEMPLLLARHAGAAPEEIYGSFTCQARRNAQGEVDGLVYFAVDVTEQVRARQQAERSEARFRRLAETTPIVVWEADARGHTTYLSPSWEQFTSTGNGQGLGWQEFVHPDDQMPFMQAWLQAVSTGEPFQAELRLRVAATGEYRWHLDRAVPVRDALGQITQWVGAAIDIHERQLAEHALQRLSQELRATNEQLTRTNVDLDNFIYTASHDLKAPISNLEGLLDALCNELRADYELPAEVPTLLGMMQHSVERFKRTIDYLTDITKLQKEHGQPATDVPLQPVIDDVLLDLQPLIQQQAACIEVNLHSCQAVSFTAKNLRSVVYNLLSNALKYRHPDRPPLVHLHCREEGAYTVLSVQDNGLGLELGQQAELFGMFRRFHSHVEGSGVGLYMVNRAVENAGGRIEVHSELGHGTTFSIYFPIKQN